jgi:putative SOS response-associated peptidase YedK
VCGRFTSTAPPEELAKYFGAAPPETMLPENYNVAPSQDIYAVVDHERVSTEAGPASDRRLETFHWGLVPMWAKDEKVGYKMINARAETITTKNAYRSAFKRRRCLIPADGFYEWKVVGKDEKGRPKKQPYYIHRPDDEPLAMAGVWERWRGPDRDREEALHSTAVVTTSANTFMSDIHDRMPVFLPPAVWDEWLDPGNDDVDSLKQLLVPAPEELLTAHPVDPKVGNVRNKGPELVEPYSP